MNVQHQLQTALAKGLPHTQAVAFHSGAAGASRVIVFRRRLRQETLSVPNAIGSVMVTKPHLLIVEDHLLTQKVISLLCEEYGFTSVIVGSCSEASKVFTSGEPFSLILMDLKLPDKSGNVCAEEFRATMNNGERIPIVAMSGLIEERQRCLSEGMDDFLAKPFSSAEFQKMVHKWSNRSKVDASGKAS